jgi:hypothetical protein
MIEYGAAARGPGDHGLCPFSARSAFVTPDRLPLFEYLS